MPSTEVKKKLKDACRTRWIEQIDSYVVFLELLPAVVTALWAIVSRNQFENICCDWNWDRETITKASGFIHHIELPSFLVTFKILLEVLVNLKGLTLKIQMQAGDVFCTYKQVTAIADSLKGMRSRSEKGFSRILMEATKLGKDLHVHGEDFELRMPRINRWQVHRSNVQAQSADDYFLITIYNEFLSHVISELQSRFVDNESHSVGLLHILPSECCSTDKDAGIPEKLRTAVDFYAHDFPHAILFPTEYRMWVNKWSQHGPGPKNLVDVLSACDSTSFPNTCSPPASFDSSHHLLQEWKKF